jgi:sugar phosphate isomerase/epimerase
MRIGYNTNGLAHHDPIQALYLLAETGYESVAITIDHNWLSPFSDSHEADLRRISDVISELKLATVIETGARFLLDRSRKHWPTLIERDPHAVQKRVDFLKYCVDVGAALGSDCVSLWSGQKPADQTFSEAIDQLAKNLEPVLRYAEFQNIDLGFEPEPGMLVDTTGRFERLLHLIDSPRLKMTMDLGHLFCLSEVPIVGYIEKWADRIVNIHIEDMCAGVHEHLMFGEGQIYFPPVIESLYDAGYDKGLHVELSHHSHDAADIVKKSFEFLKPIVDDAQTSRDI